MTKHLKIKNNQANNGSPDISREKSKAGRNNTRNILTATGAMVVGGVAGASISHLANMPNPEQEPESPVPMPPQPDQPLNTDVPVQPQSDQTTQTGEPEQPQADLTQQPQESEQPQASQHTDETVQPQVSPQQPQVAANGQTTGNPTPEQVAEALSSQIDNNDIDAPDMLSVEKLEVAYGTDGQEMNIAVTSTPDGGEYLLADTDGDGIYESLLDTDGNFLASIGANITHSDLEVSMQNGGGYLALNEFDNSAPVPIQGGDVVITDEPDGSGTDDILAQLIGPADDNSTTDGHSDDMLVESDDTNTYDTGDADHDTAEADVHDDHHDDGPLYV